MASVDDVIKLGQDIPANVVRMASGLTLGTPATVTRVIETGLSRYWTGGRMETWDDGDIPRRLFPMTVVEVDPETSGELQ